MTDALDDCADELSRLRDAYESLRGLTIRRLRQEISLLSDGLHALNQPTPKIHVMVDHAERAIDGLKSELARILRDT